MAPTVPLAASFTRPDPKRAPRPGWASFPVALSLAAAALLAPTQEAQAQEVELRIVPSAGVLMPTSVLYRSDLPSTTATLDNAPVISLGAHARITDFPISLRVNLDRADWFNTSVEGTVGFDDPQVHPFTVPTTITLLTGDVVVEPFPGSQASPYVFAGVGWKSYAFSDEEPENTTDFDFNFPEDGRSARVHYGVGVEFHVAGQAVGTEVGGNYNRFVLVDEATDAARPHDQHEFLLRLTLPFTVATF